MHCAAVNAHTTRKLSLYTLLIIKPDAVPERLFARGNIICVQISQIEQNDHLLGLFHPNRIVLLLMPLLCVVAGD